MGKVFSLTGRVFDDNNKTERQTMNDTPTPPRIPLSKIIWNSESAPLEMVDAKEYDKVCSELTAARDELAEMTARAASLAAHLPPETLCGDIQRWRDEYNQAIEQRDEYKAALRSTDNHNHEIATKLELVTEHRDTLAEALRGFRKIHSELWDHGYMAAEAIAADEALQSLNQNAESRRDDDKRPYP